MIIYATAIGIFTEFVVLGMASEVMELKLSTRIGSRIQLGCRVPSGTQENLLQWFMGDRQLSMGQIVIYERYEVHILGPGEYNLIIKSIVRSDENVYQCKSPTQVFSKIELVVEWKPEIIESQSSKTTEVMVEGSHGQLKCAASGQPTPNVTWYRRAQSDKVFRPIGVTGNVLTIPNITRYGNDVYMCNATNVQGYATWEMNVTVHFPVNVNIYETDLEVEIGDDLQMTCVIQGAPIHSYYWNFNGVRVVKNWKYVLHYEHDIGYPVYFLTLMLRPKVGRYDLGNYTCHADGFGTEAEDTIEVREKKGIVDGDAGYSVVN